MADSSKLILLLQNVNGIGDAAIRKLIMSGKFKEIFEVQMTYSALLAWIKRNEICFSKRSNIADLTIDDLKNANAKRKEIEELSAKLGIKIISYFDEDYPKRFRDMAFSKECDFPVLFYYLGDIKLLNAEKICAIIGTREASPKAKAYGMRIAKKMVDDGYVVVSGLAEGCDTIGHRGCLEAGGKTVAIVGTPLNTVFPKINKNLQNEILEKGGLVISEYPIGFKCGAFGFVQRDRLQTSGSDVVIALQTSIDGGTMHASKATHKYNKKLMTIDPSLIDDGNATGNRELINYWGAVSINEEWFLN